MKLSAEEVQSNWNRFLQIIEDHISSPRKEQLLDFYKKHEDGLVLMPASPRIAYHNAWPGGYVDHVLRVVEAALELDKVWKKFGVDSSGYTQEELVFSALNHDLGKMGDGTNYSMIPSDDEWRKKNMGEMYKFDQRIQFMKVPDRSLLLLSQAGIPVSENEWIAIQTHDGLYDEGNKEYIKAFMNECRPRTALPFILHQADLLSARIEWEGDNLAQFKDNLGNQKKSSNVSSDKKKIKKSDKALKSIKSKSLNNILDSI